MSLIKIETNSGLFIKQSRLVLLALALIFFSAINAQDEENSSWKFKVEPYLMFPNMAGEVGIGGLITSDVDASTGDIFGVLDFGAMLYLEAQTDKWSITSDFVYMDLSSNLEPGLIVNSGSVDLKQVIWELAGLYRINTILEAGVGLRYNSIEMGLSGSRIGVGQSNIPFNLSNNVNMVDPIIISRVSNNFAQNWIYQFRGDIGGFGVGSDLTWQLQGLVGYNFSKLFLLSAGYRYLSIDYDDGSGADQMIINLGQYGWMIKLAFRF